MQARTILPCLIALSVIITGCPFSTEVPFSNKSSADKIDNALIGTWNNAQSDVEANEVVISKGQAANTYKIKITETGELFEANTELFTGWITTLNKTRFLVLQEVLESGPGDEYYLYTIESDGKNLTTYYVNYEDEDDDDDDEHARTVNEYQKQVLESRNTEDFLMGEIVWSKK